MAKTLLDYVFSKLSVSNQDGSFPITFTGAVVSPGPGKTLLGEFPQALDLGPTGKGSLKLTGLQANAKQFCIRLIFQANGPVDGRQNLVESSALPFSLFLSAGLNPNEFVLDANVKPKDYPWNGPSTRFLKPLNPGTWYLADLAYDVDTAALFINGELVSVYAFPQGVIDLLQGNMLFVGTGVDGLRNHFNGKIAALQWYDSIPAELEAALDERRTNAEWFISYKYESFQKSYNLGTPTAGCAHDFNIGAFVQSYDHGLIMYNDSLGAAFEMHGGIWEFYKNYQQRADLGYLVSDETDAAKPGGRISFFSKGCIYWSGAFGAVPVLGQIYLDYQQLGGSKVLGFPKNPASAVPGGFEQVFEGANLYYRQGASSAHEVHGGILAKFLAQGGVAKLGFPVTNEADVKDKDGHATGKSSEFEHGTIYWSPGTGAFEVHGDIRQKYLDQGGPSSTLGFPISDEGDIPGVAGPGRHNCFQNGSILWYGSRQSIVVARPFNIFLGRIDSKESEGIGMGQNDLYCFVTVEVAGAKVYNQRHPQSGDWSESNIVDVNEILPVVITPNDPNIDVVFTMDVWDADGAHNDDDHLGVYSHVLNMANGWGFRENSDGFFNSGSFSWINSLTWSVQPQVDVSSLSESQKFWGVRNQGTDPLTYQQYAAAFRNVDSEPEWYDPGDWFEEIFYSLVVKHLAEKGNCVGMSLQAIYARKFMSPFSLPLDRFRNWDTVVNEFNIKHCYQVGAGPIWWFVKEFLTGNTHDPVDVFRATRDEFNRGNNPVLCIAQNYDFSGHPHCILPVQWHDESKPWRITICDPNFPSDPNSLDANLKELLIDPDNNTYDYNGANAYHGGEWSGGRFHYLSFDLVNRPPRAPIWDAILLIIGGLIIIIGDDAETSSITDSQGNDLDGFGARAVEELKAKRPLDNFFVGFKGYDAGKGMIPGQLLLRLEKETSFATVGGIRPLAGAGYLTIDKLLEDRRLQPLKEALQSKPEMVRAVSNRTVHHVLADPTTTATLTPETLKILTAVAAITGGRDFTHKIKGVRAGNLDYMAKRGLQQFRLQSELNAGENCEVRVSNMGSSRSSIQLKSPSRKMVKLEVENKIGLGENKIKITAEGLPVEPGKDLSFSLKPGLGGIEILTAVPGLNARVTITGTLDGKPIDRNFMVPLEGGVRLNPTTVVSQDGLRVDRIERFFGPSISRLLVR
jgi:hypothetical protein